MFYVMYHRGETSTRILKVHFVAILMLFYLIRIFPAGLFPIIEYFYIVLLVLLLKERVKEILSELLLS